jgi:hypothetical protein
VGFYTPSKSNKNSHPAQWVGFYTPSKSNKNSHPAQWVGFLQIKQLKQRALSAVGGLLHAKRIKQGFPRSAVGGFRFIYISSPPTALGGFHCLVQHLEIFAVQ